MKRSVGQLVFGVLMATTGIVAYYVGATLTNDWTSAGALWPLGLGVGLGVTFFLLPPRTVRNKPE